MQGSVCKSLAYLASLNLEIRKRRKLLTNIINGAAVTAKLAKMVSFDTRGAQFEPSHQLFYIEHVFSVNCMEKTKIKKREAGKGPFKTNLIKLPSRSLLLEKKFR